MGKFVVAASIAITGLHSIGCSIDNSNALVESVWARGGYIKNLLIGTVTISVTINSG